jgi:rod shape-determining protein MreC
MWEAISRYRSAILIGVLVLAPLVLLYAQTRDPEARGPVVGLIVDVAGVLERGMLAVTGAVDDGLHKYVMNMSASEELPKAVRKAQRAKVLEVRLAEVEAENQTLRRLAGLALRMDGPRPVGARVIGRSGAPLARILRIDRGRGDGVERGDAVVGAGGAVGQVLAVGRAASDVILLTDPGSSLDVVVQRTRARGIIEGTGDDDEYRARVRNFSRHADVRVGDALVTSGIGSRFPPGLLVGEVTKTEISEDNLYVSAEVRPAAVLSSVEHVLVLVGRELPRAPSLSDEPEGADAGPAP